MIILSAAFRSLEEYLPQAAGARLEAPDTCPSCGSNDSFIRHGGYWRKVTEGQHTADVKVPRFKCKRCLLAISVLFGFLLPYRRFTVRAVAAGLQGYACEEGSYSHRAYEISCLQLETETEEASDGDLPVRPAASQVFRWVQAVTVAVESLLQQVQKELTLGGLLVPESARTCPNSPRAHSSKKATALNAWAALLAAGSHLVAAEVEVARKLHAYFLSAAETCGNFLMGIVRFDRKTQSLQRVIF